MPWMQVTWWNDWQASPWETLEHVVAYPQATIQNQLQGSQTMWSGEANIMRSHKIRSGKDDDANVHTTDNHTKPNRAKATMPIHTEHAITQNQIGQRRRRQCTHNMQSHKTKSGKGDDANAHTTCNHTKLGRAKAATPMHTQHAITQNQIGQRRRQCTYNSPMQTQCTNANIMRTHNAHTTIAHTTLENNNAHTCWLQIP